MPYAPAAGLTQEAEQAVLAMRRRFMQLFVAPSDAPRPRLQHSGVVGQLAVLRHKRGHMAQVAETESDHLHLAQLDKEIAALVVQLPPDPCLKTAPSTK
jgi:hypothetical protein